MLRYCLILCTTFFINTLYASTENSTENDIVVITKEALLRSIGKRYEKKSHFEQERQIRTANGVVDISINFDARVPQYTIMKFIREELPEQIILRWYGGDRTYWIYEHNAFKLQQLQAYISIICYV